MSQSKQETCKKNDPVQAKKMFEDDIGEDFLSSWKPSAVKNDTTLDFGNEAPPKAKKTSFSLDKFDVDFDFDGGFSKLSTFDVDMSDLDFRSPPSKTQKSKEKIQENSQEKKEGFQFKFDFNGLDGFDLDCTLLKGKEEKKNHVKEKTSMPSSEGSEGISKSKGKEILGKEEKENSAQEKESMPSNENVSISKSKVISKNVNNNSESHDSGAVPQRSSVAYSKFNLSEFSTEVADSEHGGPSKSSSQSPCTSVSQDLGSKQCRKTTPEKRSIMEDSLFGNLLRTGDSNAVKQKSRFTESKYFDKVAVSKSKNKLISQNVDDNSESSDSGTVLKQLTLAHSKSKHSEFSMEQVDFQHDIPPKSLAKSPLTNGFQNGETNLCKQPSADKHGLIAGTFFGNLLQTGDTINVKQTSNPTESKYSDKVAVSKSKSKLTSQNIDDNLESCDDGTVPKQPTVPNSKSTLSELCIEDIDSQHGVPPKSLAQSPCTSGSQDAGIEQCKQITADKQGDIVDTCFGNTLKAGDSNTLKQKSTLTQSRYSDKMGSSPTLSSYSGSSDKSLSHIVSPSKGTRATKGLEGDEDQSLAQTAARLKGMADYDSTSKNSNPGKIERSKCTPDNYTSANICAVDCSDMKLLSRKLDTAAQKDINDNTRSQVNQCQNQEGFGEYKSTLPRTPFSVMQREITSQKNVTPKSITDQTRKQELNVITDESASEKPSDEKRCLSGDANINGPPVPMKKIQVHCSKPSSVSTQKLSRHSDINPVLQQKEGQHDGIRNRHQDNVLLGSNKIHQTTSLAKDGHKVALDRNYSAAESKTHHGPQKSLLSGVAKTNETKIRVGKDPLWESSKLIDSGKKLASVMIPRKHSQNPPTLQVSRPQSANGKPKTLLKQTSERLSSSKPTISISANISLSKKIFPLTEQKITTLSPMPPLKRKPMELIAEASSMNPLKRISGSLSVTEKKKSRNCSPSLEGIATDQTYGEIPRGSLSESLSGELSEDKSCQKPTKSFVQEEVMETDRQVAFSSSIDQTDQHLNRHSPNQEDTRDSADISMLEGDDNVEKADNCSRDLEDMCNMLKRKHEEAKDLLVRAIVTNNLLLMLNHPLHEEKIQTIKRYVTSTFPEECTR